MLEKIDVRQALQVFEKIRQHGARTDDGYVLDGVTAQTDFDGYSITLKNDYVTLRVLFHNKFNFDYTNRRERDLFLDKLQSIAKADYR